MQYDTSMADAAFALAQRWDEARSTDLSFKRSDLDSFDANQVGKRCLFDRNASCTHMATVLFLETLKEYPAFDRRMIKALDTTYKFASTRSTEIRLRFYLVALNPESGGEYVDSACEWCV